MGFKGFAFRAQGRRGLYIGLGVEGHICKIWGSVFVGQDLGVWGSRFRIAG